MKNTKKSKKTYDQLIESSYGKPVKSASRNKRKSNFSISKSFDDGEVLAQRPKRTFMEYVVQSSVVTDARYEEYIVPKASKTSSTLSGQSSIDMATLYTPSLKYTAAQEIQTDPNNPLQDDAAKLAMLDRLNDAYTARDNASVTPTIINNPGEDNKGQAYTANPNGNTSASGNNPGVQLSMDESFNDHKRTTSTDDDFVKDMQAILTGQKVFDPVNKKTVDKSQAASASQAQSENVKLPQMESKHAIFDQIAERMEYAKAYDLGSIDIDKRFSDFDKILDIEKNIAGEKKNSVKKPEVSSSKSTEPIIGNEEFIKDLDIISKAAKANEVSQATSAMPAFNDTNASAQQAAVAEPIKVSGNTQKEQNTIETAQAISEDQKAMSEQK